MIAQCVGAFMGYGLLISVSPEVALKASGPSFCVTKPSELITTQQAFCVEFVATATLIWFVCGIWDPRNAKHQESVSIRFALAVAGLASATVSFHICHKLPKMSSKPYQLVHTAETTQCLLYIYMIMKKNISNLKVQLSLEDVVQFIPSKMCCTLNLVWNELNRVSCGEIHRAAHKYIFFSHEILNICRQIFPVGV